MLTMIAAREDDIRALAHKFWEDEGRPNGRHEIHWQRALAAASIPDVKPTKKAAANDVSLTDGPKIAKARIVKSTSKR